MILKRDAGFGKNCRLALIFQIEPTLNFNIQRLRNRAERCVIRWFHEARSVPVNSLGVNDQTGPDLVKGLPHSEFKHASASGTLTVSSQIVHVRGIKM